MTNAPERIKAWVTRNGVTKWESGSLQFPPDTEVEYIRADIHRAEIAAAYEAVISHLLGMARSLGMTASSSLSVLSPIVAKDRADVIEHQIIPRLRLLTPDDAKAALDAHVRRAVEAEREACAAIADAEHGWTGLPHQSNMDYGPNIGPRIAAAIRAIDPEEIVKRVKEEDNG